MFSFSFSASLPAPLLDSHRQHRHRRDRRASSPHPLSLSFLRSSFVLFFTFLSLIPRPRPRRRRRRRRRRGCSRGARYPIRRPWGLPLPLFRPTVPPRNISPWPVAWLAVAASRLPRDSLSTCSSRLHRTRPSITTLHITHYKLPVSLSFPSLPLCPARAFPPFHGLIF